MTSPDPHTTAREAQGPWPENDNCDGDRTLDVYDESGQVLGTRPCLGCPACMDMPPVADPHTTARDTEAIFRAEGYHGVYDLSPEERADALAADLAAAQKALRLCASAAGHYDPEQACRNIIAIVKDALKKERSRG